MKALSIKQPWAMLIALGIKPIENRTWKTHFRGTVYIHASGKIAPFFKGDNLAFTPLQWNDIDAKIDIKNKEKRNSLFTTSAIIGEVNIIDCVINHPSIWAEKDTHNGKPIWNWVLENPILYDKPILNVKGKLSFWEPDPNQICANCGGKYLGHEPQYCCNGKDCGCMGQPTEPVACDSCYQKFYVKR